MIHYRDDKLIGKKLNNYFGKDIIDYTEWECWQTGSLLWALHSYIEYQSNMLNKFQVELAVLNEGGQITRSVIKKVYKEIFPRYERLTALISPNNKQACKFARVAGFTLEGRLRKVDKGGDVNIYSILEQEYRYKWAEYSEDHQSHHRHQIQQKQ